MVGQGKQWRRLTLLMQQTMGFKHEFQCSLIGAHLHDSPADCLQEINLLLGFEGERHDMITIPHLALRVDFRRETWRHECGFIDLNYYYYSYSSPGLPCPCARLLTDSTREPIHIYLV